KEKLSKTAILIKAFIKQFFYLFYPIVSAYFFSPLFVTPNEIRYKIIIQANSIVVFLHQLVILLLFKIIETVK
ncbi:hypothetical protein, partial [Lactobacillus helveticus]|uniref:hypothetical protein n=1 Tax=Lactobacillus helveticus TaxID=1587 RepID=UPI001C2622CE